MARYKVIAICGKSASGKDTFLQHILKSAKSEINEIISFTTRPIRDSEINGKNYYFISREEFIQKIDSKEMLEFTIYNDWFYGTALDSLKTDQINVGVFNRCGVEVLMQHPDIDVYIVEMLAGDKERMLRSLHREQHPNVSEIARRFLADEKEWADFRGANFILANGNETCKDKDFEEMVDLILHLASGRWAKSAN